MDCIEHQFEAVGDTEFVKDVTHVIFYGVLDDEELFADFFTLKALSDKLNDFHLAVAEERFFRTHSGFGRCRKGIDHFGGRVAIQPNFTRMHAMYAFYEEIDGGLFQDYASCTKRKARFTSWSSSAAVRMMTRVGIVSKCTSSRTAKPVLSGI
jgi:hypothetical protein